MEDGRAQSCKHLFLYWLQFPFSGMRSSEVIIPKTHLALAPLEWTLGKVIVSSLHKQVLDQLI